MFTEETLVNSLNRKEHRAFHELYRRFFASLVRYGTTFMHDQTEAEDIVQEVFLSLWEREDDFSSFTTLRNYLYISVRNAGINQIKHRDVKEKYADWHIWKEKLKQEEGDDMLREEVYRLLFRIIDELSPRCREIMLLLLEGKRNDEIAEVLQLSVETVKTQRKNAMRQLRERMGDLYFYLFIFCV